MHIGNYVGRIVHHLVCYHLYLQSHIVYHRNVVLALCEVSEKLKGWKFESVMDGR